MAPEELHGEVRVVDRSIILNKVKDLFAKNARCPRNEIFLQDSDILRRVHSRSCRHKADSAPAVDATPKTCGDVPTCGGLHDIFFVVPGKKRDHVNIYFTGLEVKG